MLQFNIYNIIFLIIFILNLIPFLKIIYILIIPSDSYFIYNKKYNFINYKYDMSNIYNKDSFWVFYYLFINLLPVFLVNNNINFFIDKSVLIFMSFFIFILNLTYDDFRFIYTEDKNIIYKFNLYILILIFACSSLLYWASNLILIYLIFEIASYIFFIFIYLNNLTFFNNNNLKTNKNFLSSIIQQLISNSIVSIFLFLYIIYIICNYKWYDFDLFIIYKNYINDNFNNKIYNLDKFFLFISILFKLGFPPFIYFKYNIYNNFYINDLFIYIIIFFLFFILFFSKIFILFSIFDNSIQFNNLIYISIFLIIFITYSIINDFFTDKEILLFSSYLTLSLIILIIIKFILFHF